jgi:hypothetical protein
MFVGCVCRCFVCLPVLVRPWSGMIYFAFVVIPLVAVQTVTLRRKHVLLSNTPGTRAIAPCNNATMYLVAARERETSVTRRESGSCKS